MNAIEAKIDKLGYLKAQIADLQKQAKELNNEVVQELDQRGLSSYDGALFQAAVVKQERKTVNWQKIALKFNPSVQLIAGNTKVTPVVSLKLSARKQSVAA